MGRQTHRSKQAGLHAPLGEQHKRPQDFLDTTTSGQSDTPFIAQDSPLLDLPPEIRNRIYYFALGGRTIHVRAPRTQHARTELWFCKATTSDETAASTARSATSRQAVERFDSRHENCGLSYGDARHFIYGELPLALLLTCRQIHQETAAIPFECNEFIFDNCDASRSLESSLIARQTTSTSKAIIGTDFNYDEFLRWMRGLSRLPGLRTLTIFARMSPRSRDGWTSIWADSDSNGYRKTIFNAARSLGSTAMSAVNICLSEDSYDPRTSTSGYYGWTLSPTHARPDIFGPFCEELEKILTRA